MKKKIWVILLCAAWALAVLSSLGWYMVSSAQQVEDPLPTESTAVSQIPTETLTEPPEVTLPPETEATEEATKETADPNYQMTARYSFVHDLGSGETIHGGAGLDDRIYPASITKLFTAYVALQYMDLDTVVTAGDELDMVAEDSSFAGIEKGNSLTVNMLIEGMILPSGNDAAHVLAAAVGRRVSENPDMEPANAVKYFVDLMNAEAKALGLTGSHFVNPDGYHADGHYTTGRDLITIAKLALKNSVIRGFAGRREDGVTYVSGEKVYWKNTNVLLHPGTEYFCPTARGLKTGFTSAAGNCMLSAFLEDGRYIIIGVFGSTETLTRFDDTLHLYRKYVQ